MRVLDRATNEVIDLSSADSPDAVIPGILSGDLAPDLDASYQIKLPGGQTSEVPGSQLELALKQGASFYGKNDLLKQQESDKFESLPQQLAAGGLGAARGLSLGLSDLALTKSGAVSPEYLQKQEEYNPEAGIAGEIGGAILPSLFSGGSSIAANILSKTPAGLVNTIGAGAASLGAGAASKLAPKAMSPLVQGVVSRATQLGLGSAAEGALYGGGKAVSESAIQNKPLTAEAVLSEGGYGALLGGLGGAALGAGAEIAGVGAKKALSKISDLVGDSKDLESRLVARGLGANKKQMGAILGNEFKQEAINDAYKAVVNGIDDGSALDASFKSSFDRAKASPLNMDSVTISNEELANGVSRLKEKAGTTIEKSLDEVQSLTDSKDFLKQMDVARNDINAIDFAGKDKINSYLDRLKQEFTTIDPVTGELAYLDMTAKDLWGVRRQLDDVIYNSKDLTASGLRADNSFTNALAKGRSEVEKRLEEMIETSGGNAYSEYKAAKKAYAGASDIEKLVEHQNAKAANNLFGLTAYDTAAAGAVVGGAPGAALGFLGRKAIADYGDKAALYILSNLEKRAGALNKAVDQSIDGLMSVARKGGTVSTIGSKIGQEKEKSYDSKVKELELQQLRIDEIKRGMNETLAGMSAAAPETALQLRDKTLNAMDFLSSKMPKKPDANPLIQYQVPESEIDKFNRYATAVENPNTIMRNLKGGYISPEEVEVLKKVYPEIHLKLKTKALDLLASKNKSKNMNYQLRIQLQKLLDTKADVNLYPSSVKTLQKSFQIPQQTQQSSYPAKLPGSRAKGLNLGASASSGLESTLRRRNS